MVQLEELDISKKHITALEKKNINSVEELLRFFPLRYNDFSKETGILGQKEISCLVMIFKSMKVYDNKVLQVKAECEYMDKERGMIPVSVIWFHQPYISDNIRKMRGGKVLVCGKVTESHFRGNTELQIICPLLFTDKIEENKVVHPIYSSVQGIKAWHVKAMFPKAFNVVKLQDYYDDDFRKEFQMPVLSTALRAEHYPQTMQEVEDANRRFAFDDMLYFSLANKKLEQELAATSDIIPQKFEIFEKVKSGLPYALTQDQQQVVTDILEDMRQGKRANGLIQGDVGCGKSIVCFLIAIALAENGYQSAVMAPSKVLASQHYDDLTELTKGTALNVVYAADVNEMKAADRKTLLKNLKDGTVDIVVGTTSLISKKVVYHNLGLSVVDEEHKFGVMQRKCFEEKGAAGIHTLSMSATPIPRTLAKTIYSDAMKLYSIHTMPAGRSPVKNCVTNNWNSTGSFLLKELQAGRQAYVVCPMIDKNETERMEGVLSVEELYGIYNDFLSKYGFKVDALTGKMKKNEMEETIQDFKENRTQLLIATSVIEVGVNVPNSTVIIIHNAERFGLAGLHQLRGRVGRGKQQGYCVFFTEDLENERLNTISNTTNGFFVAMADLRMRRTGDMLHGVRQSGKNKYMDLILRHEDGLYQEVKRAMQWLEEHRKSEECLSAMAESFYAAVEEN